MQEHFVNIANVSLENFPYVLDLKVIYTLTLLKGGSKLPLILFIFHELLYSLSRSETRKATPIYHAYK